MKAPQSFPRSAQEVLIKDEYAFIQSRRNKQKSSRISRRFVNSHLTFKRRMQSMPSKISFEKSLPINEHLASIIQLIKQHQVVIVAGETGSGKTTQLPLALLEAGFGARGMIAHTQPRRLAARAVSQRIAQQLGQSLGDQVGYAVRFDEKWGSNTLVKVMTDGLLLAEISRDRFLNGYEVVILDEAHERSLNIDFLLGVLHRLTRQRPNLKVIITSATIDVQAFSKHFHDAPIVQVEGRSYPVTVHYRPAPTDTEETVLDCLEEIRRENRPKNRDILMFLATEREIFDWTSLIRKRFKDSFDVLPLYARLPPKEQSRIFADSKHQRVLLSTNVAETSLTVPNVGYVIDLGKARISRYSLRSRVQRLPIEQISQASANQRSGRCGRVAPGTCYRIFDEEEFEKSKPYTEPEIQRSNLANVVLQALHYRLGDVRSFPFLEPPQTVAINEAFRTLEELGAVSDDALTQVGRTMAQFNVDPRLSRILIEAEKRNALDEVSIIVALLASQDPRLRPLNRQQAADLAHREFNDRQSDFLSLLNLWQKIEEQRSEGNNRSLRKFLEERFISYSRVREWQSLRQQILGIATSLGMGRNKEPASYQSIHTSLLAGSLHLIGNYDQNGEYKGMNNLKFRLLPGSNQQKRKTKWVLAGEIVETSRVFARMVAKIQPRWIEEAAQDLLAYSFFDAWWDDKREEAMVLCNGSLKGLPVVSRRSVRLALHDQPHAQELFIKHCLVETQPGIEFPFLKHNRALLQSMQEIQAMERRTDIVVSPQDQYAFYRDRLPEDAVSVKTLKRWLKSAPKAEVKRLIMTEQDLLLRTDMQLDENAFPTELGIGDSTLPLSYRFAHGEIDDGVSVKVTVDQLFRLPQHVLQWHVPGFFAQKCTELLQKLPKRKRKSLLPIAHRVEDALPFLLSSSVYRVGNLFEVLGNHFNTTHKVGIEHGELDETEISPFLVMNIQLVDHLDKLIDQDRDLQALRLRAEKHLNRQITPAVTSSYEQSGLVTFPVQGLPEVYEVQDEFGSHTLYPVLHDKVTHVDLEVQTTREHQRSQNERGICRLILFKERQGVRFLKREFQKEQELVLQFATVSNTTDLFDNVLLAATKHGYLVQKPLPKTLTEFVHLIAENRGTIVTKGLSLIDMARTIVSLRLQVQRKIQTLEHSALQNTKRDLDKQLDRLVPDDFLYSTPHESLPHLERYLLTMLYRIDNLAGKVQKDEDLIKVINQYESRLYALERNEETDESWVALRFLLEEYRVSLFNQQIRSKSRVSKKRLEQELTELELKSDFK